MTWKDKFPKQNIYFETQNGILYKGNCVDILKNLPENSFNGIITDPPYLINYRTNHRKEKTHKFRKEIPFDDKEKGSKIVEIAIQEMHRVLKDDTFLYMFASFKTSCLFQKILQTYNFKLKNQIIWVKNNTSMGDLKAQYAYSYEIVLYANKGRCVFKSGKRYKDVWFYDRVSGKNQLHQHQKPVEMIEFILLNHTDTSDIILDTFAGSGTTLVACEKLKRKWIGIEIDESNCEIIKTRLEKEIKKMNKINKEIYLKNKINKRIKKVVEWGEQRDLYKYSSPLAQAFKLAEEVGELISAFNRNNQAELKNAIGDSLVVALHLLHFAGKDSVTTLIFDKKPKKVGEKIAELLIETGFLIERLYEADIKNLTAYYLNIEAFIADVCQVAEQLDINPVECLDEVLNEIKSRKGKFNELGIFVKEGENA